MQKLKSLLGSAIRDRSSSYRELARIAGSIISVALTIGPISRLFTRQMYLAIESRSAWGNTLHFSTALLEELRFWYCNIGLFNGYSLRPPPDLSTVIFSDANDVGFGGFSDRFATYYNAQLPRLNSKFASPGCSGSDALTQHWSIENNWICPPVYLSCRLGPSSQVFSWTRNPDCPGVAVGLFWALHEGSSRFKSFVVDVFVLPAGGARLEADTYVSPFCFWWLPEVQRMLALRLDFGSVAFGYAAKFARTDRRVRVSCLFLAAFM